MVHVGGTKAMKHIIKRLMYENRNQLIGYGLLGLALGWYFGS